MEKKVKDFDEFFFLLSLATLLNKFWIRIKTFWICHTSVDASAQ